MTTDTPGRPVPSSAEALATPTSLCRAVDGVRAAARLTSEAAQSMNGGPTQSVAQKTTNTMDIAEGSAGGAPCTRSLCFLTGLRLTWVTMLRTFTGCSTVGRRTTDTPGRPVPTRAEKFATSISVCRAVDGVRAAARQTSEAAQPMNA